ncbi:putative transcription factor bHLH family [Helianthus annuus]|uniref:Transcription factor bHLH family n=1 Tax=Helianthus annuus TaxID=4232 RepID=A0A9K3I6K8_HELAN|nr:transcription factor SPEECHLESS [Helianthus annuus]KAF5790514.1 putative transcription factor bHLH family [Helianthus annuus]KAJ0533955.1 putative transcription factor bHLH family [Helianthus annuus]KAJ0707171.1 putative transcription factor bHLH family [Helianthus annuus]KAJ0711192.1 putative transcription factor bHLH family [Helianthus annuus]
MSSERKYGVNQSLVSCKSKSQQVVEDGGGGSEYGQLKVSHIMVERNRRKLMNEHLSVLRSLMPCFYVRRGDQASIIGGVVDYITELQRVLQSLEAKKRRKVYREQVTHHWIDSSPRRPRPPLSPRPSVPISPRTPQPTKTYRPTFPLSFVARPSPANSFISSDNSNELMANLRSPIAEVEVKFAGGNLLLKTCSNRIHGQTTKVIAVLENLSLEVLHVDISVVDETMVNSFTIKIGVECRLSAEELAQHIQKTFC